MNTVRSRADAAFLIRDGDVPGENIIILEAASLLGGSLDGAGDAERGYSLRGGRMLTTDNYECTWDLFRTIPSATDADKSVYDETIAFNAKYKAHSSARLVDKRRARVPVGSMGFSMHDRMELLTLTNASEDDLGAGRITDWLSPKFFETEFWYMWVTTFAFQPWHSAVEFKRYLHRFMMEFTRIETLAGVKRTVYNQYDSLVVPLQRWLAAKGVRLVADCRVTDIDHTIEHGQFVVTAIHAVRAGQEQTTVVNAGDFVFFQNGSMTDASSLGSMTEAPRKLTKVDSGGWVLWEKLARGRTDFGNPAAFNTCIAQSCWESFTVTLKHSAFFDQMQQFSGNEAGTGGLVSFKDSNWLMSIVLAHQLHFANQPGNVQVFWGYALFPDRVGDFVPKAMADCTGPGAAGLEESRLHQPVRRDRERRRFHRGVFRASGADGRLSTVGHHSHYSANHRTRQIFADPVRRADQIVPMTYWHGGSVVRFDRRRADSIRRCQLVVHLRLRHHQS